MDLFGLFASLAAFAALGVNAGTLTAYYREKARNEARESVARNAIETAFAACKTTLAEAKAQVDSQAKVLGEAVARATLAEAKAAAAEAKAEGVGESLASLTAKLTTRWREEERRNKKASRKYREEADDEDEAAPRKEAIAEEAAPRGFSQEDLFAALAGQTQTEFPDPATTETTTGQKRLRRK